MMSACEIRTQVGSVRVLDDVQYCVCARLFNVERGRKVSGRSNGRKLRELERGDHRQEERTAEREVINLNRNTVR